MRINENCKGRGRNVGRMRKIFILTSIVIILGVISLILFKPKETNISKELIKRVIEIAVVSGELPDYKLIKDKENIIISSENIDPKLLPKLLNVKFTVLNPTDIKKKANKEGDFLYLKFRKIDINNWNARLTLDSIWAVPDNSTVAYLSGGGMTIKFHNFFGRWFEDKSREKWIAYEFHNKITAIRSLQTEMYFS